MFFGVIFHYATQLFQNTANNDDVTMRRNVYVEERSYCAALRSFAQ